MIALITSSIPPQAFEIIRDRIAAILAIEFANQFALDSTYPPINKIWVERFLRFNSDTETPTININLAKGEYGNRSLAKADGTYTFNIDIYTSAAASGTTGPGDQRAMVVMNKIAGMVRFILSNPVYKYLLFDAGVLSGPIPYVDRFYVAMKGDGSGIAEDALSDVVGRVIYVAGGIEANTIFDTAVPLNESTNTVKINNSNKGFYYDYNPIV